MKSSIPDAHFESGAAGQKNRSPKSGVFFISRLPLYLAFIITIFGGIFLLHRSAAQARDTMRKHHLQDIENSLYIARSIHGTYPPYNKTTWCGYINPEADSVAREEIEGTLRSHIELYAKPEKPFPSDPLLNSGHQIATAQTSYHLPYFYRKHSPSSFELFASLETSSPDNYPITNCENLSQPAAYNYQITSIWRES